MGSLSFLLNYLDERFYIQVFKFIQPMAVGFIAFSAYRMIKVSIINTITRVIMIIASMATFLFFKTPWIFPILILLAGMTTNFSDKRIPQKDLKPKRINWGNILIFFTVFAIAGFLSEKARKENWKDRGPYNLFENFYRFGSLVFGGGDVLMPMMYQQFVIRPTTQRIEEVNPKALKMTHEQFLTGSGIVRAIPGPVFSIGCFVGGMVLRDKNAYPQMQLLGCLIGSVAIFLPSALLVLFFFPVWHNLKKYAVIFRSLEGINAAVVGIMLGSTFFLLKSVSLDIRDSSFLPYINLLIILATFLLLAFTKIRPPYIVLGCLILGAIL